MQIKTFDKNNFDWKKRSHRGADFQKKNRKKYIKQFVFDLLNIEIHK